MDAKQIEMGTKMTEWVITEYCRIMNEIKNCERQSMILLGQLFPEGREVKTPCGGTDVVESVSHRTVWCKSYGWPSGQMIKANYRPEAG